MTSRVDPRCQEAPTSSEKKVELEEEDEEHKEYKQPRKARGPGDRNDPF